MDSTDDLAYCSSPTAPLPLPTPEGNTGHDPRFRGTTGKGEEGQTAVYQLKNVAKKLMEELDEFKSGTECRCRGLERSIIFFSARYS